MPSFPQGVVSDGGGRGAREVVNSSLESVRKVKGYV